MRNGRAADNLKHDALAVIRGIVLNHKGSRREALALINEVVGEALYGDFPGVIERAQQEVGL